MPKFSISQSAGRSIFWGAIITLMFILGGLVVWYVFINTQQRQVDELAAARGFNTEIPSFSGVGSSMRENVAEFFQVAYDAVTLDESGASTTETAFEPTPRLWRTNSIPSLGMISFNDASSSPAGSVRFVERTSGNIFYKPIASGAAPIRLTNTLIPYVYEVLWIDDDSLLIRHSTDGGITLRTFLGNVVQSTTTDGLSSLDGGYLDDGTIAIAINPSRVEPMLFYLVQGADGVVGLTADREGKNPKRIWSSPLSGWNISWLTPDSIVLGQKAAAGASGSVYRLSLATKEMSLVLGNLNGLTVLQHPTQDAVIYSTSQGGVLKLFSRVAGIVYELPLATFAEKCVWGRGRALQIYCAVPATLPELPLPDSWYRGETDFADRWYKVDPVTGTAEALLDPSSDFGVEIDVLRPTLNEAGDTIEFTDAKTGTPWMLRISL